MYLYVPAHLISATPPVLVGVHWCHGDAQAFYSGTGFSGLADKYGFIMIYPSAASSDGCWDVHSNATLTHNGGSDSRGIVSMVQYVLQNRQGDPARVYVTGHSSGGMMTNVLVGAYPDVFRAGAAFAGVPFSCFAGAATWNTACATGAINKTGAQWGDAVRATYPGYAGARPRMQLFHGTEDDTLSFANFDQEIKQWTNVLGVSETPSSTEANAPKAPYTRTRYRDANQIVRVEAIKEQGQPHNLEIMAAEAVHFFGLDGSSDPVAVGGTSGASSGGASNGGVGGTSSGGASSGAAGAVSLGGASNGGVGGMGLAGAAAVGVGGARAESSGGVANTAGASVGGAVGGTSVGAAGGAAAGSVGMLAGGTAGAGVAGASSSGGSAIQAQAGNAATANSESSGCSCEVTPGGAAERAWSVLLALCGLVVRRRRA